MTSINVGIFNDKELGKMMGKKGTESDITLYNRKIGEDIFTFAYPRTYPDKLAPLLQVCNLVDGAIVSISQLTPELGEIALALDSFGIKKGFLILENLVPEQVKGLFKGTVLEQYKVIERDFNSIIGELKEMEIPKDDLTRAVIDHSFGVKSVGTVALGVVKAGQVNQHDNMVLLPSGKKVLVKSIQMQDENVPRASSGDRFGFSLKGVNPEDISRGSLLVPEGSPVKTAERFKIRFFVNKFFKEPLKKGIKCLMCVGLFYESVTIEDISGTDVLGPGKEAEITVLVERAIPYLPGDRVVLARPDMKGLRIVGGGSILE